MARFSDQALRRYSRQILLREVGGRGQERIGQSSVQLIALRSGGSLASVATQYLLRAGVAEVTWYAEGPATAQPLLALAEAEALYTGPGAALQSPTPPSCEGRLVRGDFRARPRLAQLESPDLRCLALWSGAAELLPWWVSSTRCGRGQPPTAEPTDAATVIMSEEASAEAWNAAALSLGSALALGLLQELLGCAPQQAADWLAPA